MNSDGARTKLEAVHRPHVEVGHHHAPCSQCPRYLNDQQSNIAGSQYEYAIPRLDTSPLDRSNRDRMLAGVAGGIANYLAIDPTIVRLLLLVALIPLPFLPLVYFVCSLVIPREPDLL